MEWIRRSGLVAWCVAVVQMGVASVAVGQSSSPAWESVTADRLLTPEDGDWMSYRRTS